MTFRDYLSFRHFVWYGVLLPIIKGVSLYALLVASCLGFLAFVAFWAYGWGYTRWFFWDSWFSP